jgi:hypothetical protein
VTSYDRAKISSYLRTNSLKRIYLLEKGHGLPVDGVPLSTIKVTKSPGGPRGPRAPKTTIKGKYYNCRRQADYVIESPTTIVYTIDSISDMSYCYHFPKTIIQIAERDVKHIEDEDNWLTISEYLSQIVFDKLTQEEIQQEADRQQFLTEYENFKFLADDHDFKLFKDTKSNPKINDEISKAIKWMVLTNKVSPKVPDVFAKYPLLRSLKYVSYDERRHVKDYVKLVQTVSQSQFNLKELNNVHTDIASDRVLVA